MPRSFDLFLSSLPGVFLLFVRPCLFAFLGAVAKGIVQLLRNVPGAVNDRPGRSDKEVVVQLVVVSPGFVMQRVARDADVLVKLQVGAQAVVDGVKADAVSLGGTAADNVNRDGLPSFRRLGGDAGITVVMPLEDKLHAVAFKKRAESPPHIIIVTPGTDGMYRVVHHHDSPPLGIACQCAFEPVAVPPEGDRSLDAVRVDDNVAQVGKVDVIRLSLKAQRTVARVHESMRPAGVQRLGQSLQVLVVARGSKDGDVGGNAVHGREPIAPISIRRTLDDVAGKCPERRAGISLAEKVKKLTGVAVCFVLYIADIEKIQRVMGRRDAEVMPAGMRVAAADAVAVGVPAFELPQAGLVKGGLPCPALHHGARGVSRIKGFDSGHIAVGQGVIFHSCRLEERIAPPGDRALRAGILPEGKDDAVGAVGRGVGQLRRVMEPSVPFPNAQASSEA